MTAHAETESTASRPVLPSRHDGAHEADEQLRQLAELRLRNNPHLGNLEFRLESCEGRITLTGAVRTYFQKQMAQESLKAEAAVQVIDNQLEVTW